MAACSVESDAEWLVSKASECLKTNCYAARSWLITAKTLFPENFSIQFEAYGIEKSSKNIKEAASLLQDMFIKFPKETRLQREVQDISEAIQSDATDSEGLFLKEVFATVPSSIQCQMLLKVSQDTTDLLDQCRMMLILMTKFPQLVVEHGVPLIEKLISSEKHSHFSSPLNCYRKILVDDVLPLVLNEHTVNVPQKQVYRWLQKSIEFYISYVAQPAGQAESGMMSPDLKSPTRRTSISTNRRTTVITGLSEKESNIAKPLERLHHILQLTGQKLDWPSVDIFNPKTSLDSKFQSLQTLHERSVAESSSLKPVLYCASVLCLECCYNYASRVEPQQFVGYNAASPQPALVLIEGLKSSHGASSPKSKKRKVDKQTSPVIQTVSQSPATELMVESFMTAAKLWNLLHSEENIEKEYKKLAAYLKTDNWRWMKLFEFDRLIYQGQFTDAITKLTSESDGDTRVNLQLASCYYSLGRYSDACEKILAVISSLPQGSDERSSDQNMAPSDTRQLQLLPCTASELLPYCIHLLLTCFKEKAFSSNASDDMLGHMVVLLQYDWPKHGDIFEKAVSKITDQKTFIYNLFFTYVINIDILEEFAFIRSTDTARVELDILPTSVEVLAQQRTVTRGVNKGVTEDFKVTMEKQVARCNENIEQVIRQFLVEEKELLLKDLS